MNLMSKKFAANENIPSEFTVDGKNVSPPLSWSDVPADTKSFAISVTDPDAPAGTWNHWLVYDIPKEVRKIEKNSLPEGSKQVENDFGKKPYGGPSPPSGTHRYFFTVYALDVEHLENVNKRNFFEKVKEHTIDKAELKGLYTRQ